MNSILHIRILVSYYMGITSLVYWNTMNIGRDYGNSDFTIKHQPSDLNDLHIGNSTHIEVHNKDFNFSLSVARNYIQIGKNFPKM